MKRRTALVILVVVTIVAAGAWAFVLETGGHHEEAVAFVEKAGSGIGLVLVCAFLLGAFD